jgi:integrase
MRPPRKPKNIDRRTREILYPLEIDRMCAATLSGGTRHALRDALLILLMYRHGLRVSEAACLRWGQVSLDERKIHVDRINGGLTAIHPLSPDEFESLRLWKNARFGRVLPGVPFEETLLFERSDGKPLSPRTIGHIIATAGTAAGIRFPVHPQMLRHACGHFVAHHLRDPIAVQQYLGLKSLQNAMRYFKPETVEFRNIWKE